MKLRITNYKLRMPGLAPAGGALGFVSHPPRAIRHSRAFTLMEIAICLAIIGFALVAIIGVLPLGMNAQRAGREETVINQDATVLINAIRGGAQGLDYLTNYVYAVTNYWAYFSDLKNGIPPSYGTCGYSYTGSSTPNGTPYNPSAPINSGTNIVGLLSTPQFTDTNGYPIRALDSRFVNSGYSNHVVAYVRSISGLAAEKPPQDNPIMREDTFSYRLYCVNAAMPFYAPPEWQSSQTYDAGDTVTLPYATFWRAVATSSGVMPGTNANNKWQQYEDYNYVAAGQQRELRLTFLWPQLPNGKLGLGHQTFRATVAGQIRMTNNVANQLLYFYQPQFFTNAP